jgi:hypothetical protein
MCLAASVPRRGEIRTSGDNDVILLGDEVKLRQVVINLVSNALKFTGEGDVIEIRIERNAGGVDLIVEDNGEGIPADKLPIIMEPFGQAEGTYALSHGGVGPGLPIVKSLVELHGGRFTIESEVGQGTLARSHLPRERLVDKSSPGNSCVYFSVSPSARSCIISQMSVGPINLIQWSSASKGEISFNRGLREAAKRASGESEVPRRKWPANSLRTSSFAQDPFPKICCDTFRRLSNIDQTRRRA